MFGSEPLDAEQARALRSFASDFGQREIDELAALEATTRHDVKAVEYLVRAKLTELGLTAIAELTHFACTSEDINNLAYALTIRAAVREVWLPRLRDVVAGLRSIAIDERSTPMLAHTHGQPATPTTVGKEFAVFVARLERGIARVDAVDVSRQVQRRDRHLRRPRRGRSGRRLARHLARVRHLARPRLESADHPDRAARLAGGAVLGASATLNRILHNLCTDHLDVHLDGIHQPDPAGRRDRLVDHAAQDQPDPFRERRGEPRAVDRALLDSLAATLVTSRLQRDLTDSTTQRNIGVALGHSLLALDNLARGLGEIAIDRAALAADLDANWEVLGEAIQTVIRAEVVAGRSSIADPYALLKELTRGHRTGADGASSSSSRGSTSATRPRRACSTSTPADYIGLAAELVELLPE